MKKRKQGKAMEGTRGCCSTKERGTGLPDGHVLFQERAGQSEGGGGE